MRYIILTCLLSALFINKSNACLNGETLVLKSNIFVYEDREGKVPLGHILPSNDHLLAILNALDSTYTATNDIDHLSDKGLILILLGKYQEAIELYKEIEKQYPDRYATAANLGTAYELIVDNEKALFWIQKAVKIDPASHFASEWIHVNILKEKIEKPQRHTSTALIGTDFGNDRLPKSTMSKDELLKLADALYYQLNERITFIKPKDDIIATLLYDLGNISFLLGGYANAYGSYKLSKDYGISNDALDYRIAESKKLSNKTLLSKSDDILWPIVATIGILLLLMVLVIWRKSRK